MPRFEYTKSETRGQTTAPALGAFKDQLKAYFCADPAKVLVNMAAGGDLRWKIKPPTASMNLELYGESPTPAAVKLHLQEQGLDFFHGQTGKGATVSSAESRGSGCQHTFRIPDVDGTHRLTVAVMVKIGNIMSIEATIPDCAFALETEDEQYE